MRNFRRTIYIKNYNEFNLLTGISSTGYKHNISKTLNYDDASNLTQITQNKTKLVLQYDGVNRPIIAQTIADSTGTVKQPSSTLNYTYAPGGQVTNIKDAVGAEIVGYELDELMRPRFVKSGKFSIGIEFDSLGRKKQISYPNKLETTFSFDNFERLAEISTPDLGFRSYDYDPLSNISQIKFESGQLDYAYGRNSSIIGSYYRGAEAIKDELFVWDASGNRLNGTQAPKTPSIRPRPIVINNGLFEDAEPLGEETVGRYSMIYDMHGNVTKKFDNQENIYCVFEYDADNKLVYAEKYKNDSLLLKARYTFDGLGRRIEKEVTKGSVVVRKSYVYNGDDVLLEYNTSDSTPVETARYIGTGDIDDNLVAIKNGKPFFYHKDHLGSVVAITNDVGEIVQKNQYSSFGKILSIKDKNRKEIGIEGATEKSFAYTGREWDEEIDLYYYRARHYDPQIGRFVQKDPIGLEAGDSNFYRYVNNNPLNWVDPNGLARCKYSITTGKLVCTSNDGSRTASSQMFSGLTMYKNNPNQTEEFGGPIPLGHYEITKTPGAKQRDWFLDPGLLSRVGYRLGIARGGFNLHLRQGASLGCITAEDSENDQNLNEIDNILNADFGNNSIEVMQ